MKIEKLRKAILQPLLNIIPFSLVRRIGSCNLIILYFHLVNDGTVPHIRYLYEYKGRREFLDDLDFLLRHYSPIGLPDVIHWIRGKAILPANAFLLTFDDGLREISDVIAPILLQKGIPAVFFISSAFLDNRELCYQHKASLLVEKIGAGISSRISEEVRRILQKIGLCFSELPEGVLKVDYRRRGALEIMGEILGVNFEQYLKEKKPYLSSSQVKELIDRGFAIGAHSIDHPYYSGLTLVEQLEQTIVSVKKIREKFNLNYGAFAFPHNDTGVSEEVFKKIQESELVDITFGTGGMLDGGFPIHRQRVSLEKPLLPARQILAWQYARKFYREAEWGKKSGQSMSKNGF